MAALFISISSDVSVESVGSSFPRVILIGSILVEVLIAPEVGAAAVASPTEVLELDTHSSLEVDPSESSPPPISVAPMISPFLCSDDSKSDPRGMYDLHLMMLCLLDGGAKLHHHLSFHLHLALTTRNSVRPLPPHHLTLRYTSYLLDHFTSGSLSSHSSLDHSSSGNSILGHSLSGNTPPDTTDANSSTPSRFVHPSLARTPRCSEAYIHCRSSPLSTMYLPTTSESLAGDSFLSHLLDHLAGDVGLLRCRSPAATRSVEEDIDTDVLKDIKADATAIEVAVDRDVKAEVDATIDMEVNVEVYIKDEVEDEIESNDRGIVEVRVYVAIEIDIPDAMLMPDAIEHLEHVEEGLQVIYDHVIEILLQRIEDIETRHRELESRSLIVGEERASLLEQVVSLERSNARF
ncbi:hypothetical protein Tco_0681299 [Tanacetum coccineum]|uniref:Uncharacterized protein n=1 Tax=Tanacetum coccineum TaxID=301880 RepID=A0ABQ4XN53_9ASTR